VLNNKNNDHPQLAKGRDLRNFKPLCPALSGIMESGLETPGENI
jgi:hypothetical protein